MKKTKIFTLAAITMVGAFTLGGLNSRPTGAPVPASGGPAEANATCAQSGCHNGSTSVVNDRLTTDIPAAGYTPGATYNITISFSGSGQKGFMFSAQNAAGDFKGSPISGSGSKVVFTNYVTHTLAKTSAPSTWEFKWTAPAAGSGAVNLHAAFAIGFDNVAKQVVAVNENLNTGISEHNEEISLNTFANNIDKTLIVGFNLTHPAAIKVSLINYNGQVSTEIFNGQLNSGQQSLNTSTQHLASGIYFIQTQVNNQVYFKKVLITN